MIYWLLADAVLAAHFGFVLLTIFGGLLVLRWRRFALVHLAAVLWGIILQWANLTCPLTPMETRLRELGSDVGYNGGFIEHYVSMVLYPQKLTIELRFLLGLLLIAINVLIYAYILMRKR